MTRFGLLTLHVSLIVICLLNQATSEVYYIKANSTDHCIVQPYLTLYQFVINSSHYLHSNTTLVFLPGTHYLQVNLTVSNVESFVMKSENTPAQVYCIRNANIVFNLLWHVHIDSLRFIGCGGNQVTDVQEFVVCGTIFKGQENSGPALVLVDTTTEIVNCTFESNKTGSCCPDKYGYQNGGAIIATNSRVDIS